MATDKIMYGLGGAALGLGTTLLLTRKEEPDWARKVREQITTIRQEAPDYPLIWEYVGQGRMYMAGGETEEAVYIGWRITPDTPKDADAYLEICKVVGEAEASGFTVTGAYTATYFAGALVPTIPIEMAELFWT